MTWLTLLRAHTVTTLREVVRTPAFIVPTVGFPAMFYLLFGLPYARGAAAADFLVCSFVAFALVGVTLFQFGVGIASERGRPWERYLRTLPVSVGDRFAARILVALIVGCAAGGLVALEARLLSPIDFTGVQWGLLALYSLCGATPFVLLGIAVAYWVHPRGALPVVNIIYLLCSFGGGFWMPPQELPSVVAQISPYLPTRQYGELLWSIAEPGHDAVHAAWMLLAFAAGFTVIAIAGYRRDERVRYA